MNREILRCKTALIGEMKLRGYNTQAFLLQGVIDGALGLPPIESCNVHGVASKAYFRGLAFGRIFK